MTTYKLAQPYICVYNFEKRWEQTKHKLYEVDMKPNVSWALDFSIGTSVLRKVESMSQILPDRRKKTSICTTLLNMNV